MWNSTSSFALIDHFTVVCLVTWPLNESEAGVDLVLIETSLLFICKFLLISMRTASLTWEKQVSHDHRSFERNLSNCEQKPEKVQRGLNPWPREVTGSIPVEVLTFSGFCSQLLKLRSKLRWSWLTWFQIRSSIYEMFHLSLLIHSSRAHQNSQMTSSQCQWLHSLVGKSVAPILGGHGFKPH